MLPLREANGGFNEKEMEMGRDILDLLNALNNAGVTVTIHSPKWSYSSNTDWNVCLQKSGEGFQLQIDENDENLGAAIENAYNKWLRSTEKGIPNLTLKQIEAF